MIDNTRPRVVDASRAHRNAAGWVYGLPELPKAQPAAIARPGLGPQVFIREIRLTGNTAFSAEELAEVTAAYTNRYLTSEDLEALRQALTVHYVQRGYLNSGAVIPDQKVTDGVVELHIVEGRLTEIDVTGTARLSCAQA